MGDVGVVVYTTLNCFVTNSSYRGISYQSKKKGKGQESIQSSTTPDPGYQWESDNFTIRHYIESPEVSPFSAGDHKASINRHARKHNKNS